MIKRLVLAAVISVPMAAWAAEESPVGLWQSIDDVSGEPKSLIQISSENGALYGVVVELYRKPGEDQNPSCTACDGELKGKPIKGLRILSGLQKDGAGYSGGQILDPANGKLYKSKIDLDEGGKKLLVRGYVGAPLFGRTQTWIRQN